jgi:hypothetical protein
LIATADGMAHDPEALRYTSEETVAELSKEEKVRFTSSSSLNKSLASLTHLFVLQRARRKEQNRLAQQDLRRRRLEHTQNVGPACESELSLTLPSSKPIAGPVGGVEVELGRGNSHPR